MGKVKQAVKKVATRVSKVVGKNIARTKANIAKAETRRSKETIGQRGAKGVVKGGLTGAALGAAAGGAVAGVPGAIVGAGYGGLVGMPVGALAGAAGQQARLAKKAKKKK